MCFGAGNLFPAPCYFPENSNISIKLMKFLLEKQKIFLEKGSIYRERLF